MQSMELLYFRRITPVWGLLNCISKSLGTKLDFILKLSCLSNYQMEIKAFQAVAGNMLDRKLEA